MKEADSSIYCRVDLFNRQFASVATIAVPQPKFVIPEHVVRVRDCVSDIVAKRILEERR
jgi:hypothetical protein